MEIKVKDKLDIDPYDSNLKVSEYDVRKIKNILNLKEQGKIEEYLKAIKEYTIGEMLKKYLILNEFGIMTDEIKEIVNNYKKLKEIRPTINSELFTNNLEILKKPLFNRLGPTMISDLCIYRNTLDYVSKYQEDEFLQETEAYLRKNNLYSKNNLYKIFSKYNLTRELLKNLVTNDIKLEEIDINNFKLYLENIENDKISYELDNIYSKTKVSNIIELRNYKDIIITQGYNAFEEISNYSNKEAKNKIENILYYSLFGKNIIPDEFYNEKLIEKCHKKNIINEYDQALIEIIKDIKISNIENIKQKYRDILKKNIRLTNKFRKLVHKLCRQSYEQILYDEINNNEFHLIDSKEYNGKKIPILETKESFKLLVHGIMRRGMDENATDFGEKLEKNPEYWNKSIDKSSTISCSLISENHTEHVDGFVDLVFDNLPNNELLYMGSGDIDTEHGVCLYNPRQMHPKPISYSSPERLIKNTKNYNEISIYRKNKKMKNFFGKIQPSYILVYDKNKEEYSNSSIGKQALEYAAYFNVPIIYLNEKKYKKIIEAKTEKYKNGDIDNFNIKDIKAIMELNTMTEEESLELIMKYIDKSTLSEEKFNNMINEIKEYLTNYYIDSSKNINKAINLLEKHAINHNFSKEETDEKFK